MLNGIWFLSFPSCLLFALWYPSPFEGNFPKRFTSPKHYHPLRILPHPFVAFCGVCFLPSLSSSYIKTLPFRQGDKGRESDMHLGKNVCIPSPKFKCKLGRNGSPSLSTWEGLLEALLCNRLHIFVTPNCSQQWKDGKDDVISVYWNFEIVEDRGKETKLNCQWKRCDKESKNDCRHSQTFRLRNSPLGEHFERDKERKSVNGNFWKLSSTKLNRQFHLSVCVDFSQNAHSIKWWRSSHFQTFTGMFQRRHKTARDNDDVGNRVATFLCEWLFSLQEWVMISFIQLIGVEGSNFTFKNPLCIQHNGTSKEFGTEWKWVIKLLGFRF